MTERLETEVTIDIQGLPGLEELPGRNVEGYGQTLLSQMGVGGGENPKLFSNTVVVLLICFTRGPPSEFRSLPGVDRSSINNTFCRASSHLCPLFSSAVSQVSVQLVLGKCFSIIKPLGEKCRKTEFNPVITSPTSFRGLMGKVEECW